MQACFNVETGLTTRKSESFTRFWRKLSVLSLLLEIFRHSNTIFDFIFNAECYARLFQCRNRPNCTQNAPIYSILTKIKRAFAPVGDVSKFKRYFHCILNAEWYARPFQRRNRPNFKLNAPIYSILKKIKRPFAPVGDISKFKRYFHYILDAECSPRSF